MSTSNLIKAGTAYAVASVPVASATVIPANSFIGLTSGLAVVAVAGTTKLAYTRAGSAAGETTLSVVRDPSCLFSMVSDANLAAANRGAEVDLVLKAAILTTGAVGETSYAPRELVTDGSFRISIDGTGYNCDAIDFSADTSMADVAATMQAVLRTATSESETITYSATTEKFTITTVGVTAASAVTVLSASTGTVGTDISVAVWMNGLTGSGNVTDYSQQADLGTSSTDVFLVDAGENAADKEGDTDVTMKINPAKFIFG